MRKSLTVPRVFTLVLVVAMLALATVAIRAESLKIIAPSGRQTSSNAVVTPTLDNACAAMTAQAAFTVSTTTATIVPTLTAGTKAIKIFIFDAAANIGGTAVSSASVKLPGIASGSDSGWIPVSTTTPGIYLIGNSSTAPTAAVLERR